MNRKGVFISLTAILILAALGVTAVLEQAHERAQHDIEAQFLEYKLAAEYVRALEDSIIESRLHIASKSALASAAHDHEVLSDTRLATLIRTGQDGSLSIPESHTLTGLEGDVRLLPHLRVTIDEIHIDSVRLAQVDPWTIEVRASVWYRVRGNDAVWENRGDYRTHLLVSGLTHPGADDRRIVREFWMEDGDDPCYLSFVYDDAQCNGIVGLCAIDACPSDP